jgi:hypothetical protein
MSCVTCICPKETCPNHGKCCQCIKKHKDMDSLPYCLFETDNKSLENYYNELKKRFEGK